MQLNNEWLTPRIIKQCQSIYGYGHLVTLTITTCKRLDLFIQTMHSFLEHCLDHSLIDRWICIDDQSSEDDRRVMQELFPFFEFIWKTPEEIGHAKSMNIIRDLVNTPFLFHMEDDWLFEKSYPFVSSCLQVLLHHPQNGQCLINKNYSETYPIQGGIFCIDGSLGYLIHDYHPTEWKNPVSYWPHFSLRPGMWKRAIMDRPFNEAPYIHFEREYAEIYKEQWHTTFLNGVYCRHIGRLTQERHDKTKKNAYQLNNQPQFGITDDNTDNTTVDNTDNTTVDNTDNTVDNTDNTTVDNTDNMTDTTTNTTNNTVDTTTNTTDNTVDTTTNTTDNTVNTTVDNTDNTDFSMPVWVINLDRRPDRWEKTMNILKDTELYNSIRRIPAIDGESLHLTRRCWELFSNNDYHFRRGMIGCALTHIQCWIEISRGNQCVIILEDDITNIHTFSFARLQSFQASQPEMDVCFLGYHLCKPSMIQTNTGSHHILRADSTAALDFSYGGTFAYMITPQGAHRLLQFIQGYGMKHGIDTMIQKFADVGNVCYVYPMYIESPMFECWNDTNEIDSDIQKDYSSLRRSIETCLSWEIEYYKGEGRNVYVIDKHSTRTTLSLDPDDVYIIHLEKCIEIEFEILTEQVVVNTMSFKDLIEQIFIILSLEDHVLFVPNKMSYSYRLLDETGEWSMDELLSA